MGTVFKCFLVAACIYLVQGDQFTVLKAPKSLEFNENSENGFSSEVIQDIFATSLGYSTISSPDWDGLTVNDPFNLASGIVNIVIEGLDKFEYGNAKTFQGRGSGDSISSILDNIKNHDGVVVDLDLKSNAGSTLETVFGVIEPKYVRKTTVSKDFLNQIAMIDGLSQILNENDNHVPTAIVLRVSFDGISKTKETTRNEMMKVLKESIEDFVVAAEKAYKNQALISLMTTTEKPVHKRTRRAAGDDESNNIAPAYDENYPVIFNIIFWFAVVMIFSLIAISLAIGNMDPGRDSIIYRMTSTRMKKDN